VSQVRNTTEVIGQHKAPAVIELRSVLAVLAADVAYEANNFTSEGPCWVQPEQSYSTSSADWSGIERVRETSYPKFWFHVHQTPIAPCNWPEQQYQLWCIRGSIVGGLIHKRKVRETSYPKFWFHVHQTPIAPCNWPEQQYHLWCIRGSIVGGLIHKRKVRETSYPKFWCPML